MEDEIWKEIPDTDGIYFISNKGHAKKVSHGVDVPEYEVKVIRKVYTVPEYSFEKWS